jgi:hypothetical protein
LILLNTLNDQLSERGGAIATCPILRITADGDLTLANAWHLAPYLNCMELLMEGTLPIGMLPAFRQGDDILVLRIQRQPESEGFIDAVTTVAAT